MKTTPTLTLHAPADAPSPTPPALRRAARRYLDALAAYRRSIERVERPDATAADDAALACDQDTYFAATETLVDRLRKSGRSWVQCAGWLFIDASPDVADLPLLYESGVEHVILTVPADGRRAD